MKIFTLKYSGSFLQPWANLGDDIQSIAAKRLLPKVDGHLYREALAETRESGVVSMNGFFMEEGGWPPAESLEPFFFSFHISARAEKKICSSEGIAYLRKYAPIGCRDQGTRELLARHGIDAYVSKCVSLTFAKRSREPVDGKVFLVNLSKAAESIVPRRIRKQAFVVNQAKLRLPALTHETRESLAEHLLETYANHASLVITSKIHCAMPCVAMGIPVVFLYDESKRADYRVQIVESLIGINYVRDSWLDRKVLNPQTGGRINWSPAPVDIEAEKKLIIKAYQEAFQKAVRRFSQKSPARQDLNVQT